MAKKVLKNISHINSGDIAYRLIVANVAYRKRSIH
jgi:hypothetical protein